MSFLRDRAERLVDITNDFLLSCFSSPLEQAHDEFKSEFVVAIAVVRHKPGRSLRLAKRRSPVATTHCMKLAQLDSPLVGSDCLVLCVIKIDK